jgi:hypothetical protein
MCYEQLADTTRQARAALAGQAAGLVPFRVVSGRPEVMLTRGGSATRPVPEDTPAAPPSGAPGGPADAPSRTEWVLDAITLAAGVFDTALGIVMLGEYALGRGLGVDQLVVKAYLSAPREIPGRPPVIDVRADAGALRD